MRVSLRAVGDDDDAVFFAYGTDPEGIRMAAFTAADPSDRDWFDAHRARIRQDPSVIERTIIDENQRVLGSIAVYGPPDEREVTYWIGREHWGRGVATAALRALLCIVSERPLHARAAADNAGSLRVLEKCGFLRTGTGRGFANGRGEETDEVLLTLTR
jgi:RimJ/RimL family protein N-acetyltransferase